MDEAGHPCTSPTGELSPSFDISILPIEKGLFSQEEMEIIATTGVDSVDVRCRSLLSSEQSKTTQGSSADEVKDSSMTHLMSEIPVR